MKINPHIKQNIDPHARDLKKTIPHQHPVNYKGYQFRHSTPHQPLDKAQCLAWCNKVAIPSKPNNLNSKTIIYSKNKSNYKTKNSPNSPRLVRKKVLPRNTHTNDDNQDDESEETTQIIQRLDGKDNLGNTNQNQQFDQKDNQKDHSSSEQEQKNTKPIRVSKSRRFTEKLTSKISTRLASSPICFAFEEKLARLAPDASHDSRMSYYVQAYIAIQIRAKYASQEQKQGSNFTTQSLRAELHMLNAKMANAQHIASINTDAEKNNPPFSLEKARLFLIENSKNISESSSSTAHSTFCLLAAPSIISAAAPSKLFPHRMHRIENLSHTTKQMSTKARS